MEKYSIVIPVYKSSKSLEILTAQINELQSVMDCMFEIIFVNDSPFFIETCNTLKKINNQNDNVRIVTLRKNQGQHIAVLVGLKFAKGKYVITMDDDLQHPVKEIPKLLKAMDENENIEAVFAVPQFQNKKHSLWRNASSYLLNKVDAFFLKKPKGLMKSPFQIMTNDLALALVSNYNAMPSISSLILNTTQNVINIEVSHSPREFGKSNYTFRKMCSLALNNMIHYSSLPLKFMGTVGFAGFLFSIIFITIIFIRKFFFEIEFPGYASTVTLICFFGGLNLFAVGIIGEYLIRIIKEQQKPKLGELIKNYQGDEHENQGK
jgi:glycosyltransferase involved in cell wall biosynthesis